MAGRTDLRPAQPATVRRSNALIVPQSIALRLVSKVKQPADALTREFPLSGCVDIGFESVLRM